MISSTHRKWTWYAVYNIYDDNRHEYQFQHTSHRHMFYRPIKRLYFFVFFLLKFKWSHIPNMRIDRYSPNRVHSGRTHLNDELLLIVRNRFWHFNINKMYLFYNWLWLLFYSFVVDCRSKMHKCRITYFGNRGSWHTFMLFIILEIQFLGILGFYTHLWSNDGVRE